jgi:hypothetical protein
VELTDNNLLAENLHRLERQAAVVAAMLDFDNTELGVCRTLAATTWACRASEWE